VKFLSFRKYTHPDDDVPGLTTISPECVKHSAERHQQQLVPTRPGLLFPVFRTYWHMTNISLYYQTYVF